MHARTLLLVALVTLAPAVAALPLAAEPARCDGFAVRPGLGPSCPVEGGYEITLPDGRVLFTHGVDPVLPTFWGRGMPFGPREPACVEDALSQRHNLVIYARPLGAPDHGEPIVAELRHMVALANGLLNGEAVATGAPGLDYRMLCQDGQVQVDTVMLPLPASRGSDSTVDFHRVVAAVRALGYDNPNAKYWIWYDDMGACACAGVAESPRSIVRSPYNQANAGPNYAVTFGYTGVNGAYVLMHENGHNLGAVANVAPASSGAGHCNDGLDVMCYPDGGPTASYKSWVCSDRVHFDCRHDTYFHARPQPDTYLGLSWNLASPLNRFVEGCLHAELLLTPAALGIGGNEASVDVPAACRGARFAAMGEHGAPPTQSVFSSALTETNDVDVCWYDDARLLRCDARRTWSEGEVPLDATRAVVKHVKGADGRVTLSIV